MIDAESLAAEGRRAGLCAVGVCRAAPFDGAARILRERKRAGLHAGMQFTYRNPERSTDPARSLPSAAALVVGALDYHTAQPPPPDNEQPLGRVAAYARSDHYAALRRALEAVAALLRAERHRAVVVADENHMVDRAAAYRAGIGWWGKSANILVPGAGSMAVLGAVITDAPLVRRDPAPIAEGCGSCRRCLDGCPTGAITSPGTVDARRCLAWLVQADGVFDPRYRVALGDRIYGCDDCGDVCPPNRVRFLRTRRQPADPGAAGDAWVPLIDMLAASDAELMSQYGRWYIPRREPRYLRRNALVVLANVGDPMQPGVRAAVNSALADSDPLIAAHAVWCARRLLLPLDALKLWEHPLVAAELERWVPPRDGLRPAAAVLSQLSLSQPADRVSQWPAGARAR